MLSLKAVSMWRGGTAFDSRWSNGGRGVKGKGEEEDRRKWSSFDVAVMYCSHEIAYNLDFADHKLPL